jgi:DNA (cytosine-5)-methyltransferase 1
MLLGLDLFSGIGGLTLALAPWVEPVAYCENDRYAQSILLSRMASGSLPSAPIWDDVRTLRGGLLQAAPEIITGGFPCQDLSVAGNGAGLAGERSGLFFEIARLASEIRPSFIFLENVPAIRSRGADVVTGRLAELGYDCRWGVLSAFDVGAPHLRDRWWLLAHRNGDRCEVEPQRDGEEPEGGGSRQRDPNRLRDPLSDPFGDFLREQQGRWGGESRPGQAGPRDDGEKESLADTMCKRPSLGSLGASRPTLSGTPGECWWSLEPDVGRVAHGIPHRVDRLRALGNSVCPAAARAAFAGLAGLVDTGVPGWQTNIPTNRPR